MKSLGAVRSASDTWPNSTRFAHKLDVAMIIELLVLGVLPAVIVIVLAAMVFSVGVACGLPPELAFLVSISVLGPTPTAVKDLWIAISGREGEGVSDRIAAGVRSLAIIV